MIIGSAHPFRTCFNKISFFDSPMTLSPITYSLFSSSRIILFICLMNFDAIPTTIVIVGKIIALGPSFDTGRSLNL